MISTRAFLKKKTRSGIGLGFALLFTASCIGAFLIVAPIDNGGERGWLTGPLLYLLDFSPILFLIAGIAVWIMHRIAAVAALMASLTCWPWLLYAIDPNIYKPAYLVYRSLDARVAWSKSVLPSSLSYNPWLWLTVLYFVFIGVLSVRLLRYREPSGR